MDLLKSTVVIQRTLMSRSILFRYKAKIKNSDTIITGTVLYTKALEYLFRFVSSISPFYCWELNPSWTQFMGKAMLYYWNQNICNSDSWLIPTYTFFSHTIMSLHTLSFNHETNYTAMS